MLIGAAYSDYVGYGVILFALVELLMEKVNEILNIRRIERLDKEILCVLRS